MTVASPQALAAMSERDQRNLEWKVLVLQSTIAAFFVAGALTGWFGDRSTEARTGAAWIGSYHVLHAWYVLQWRARRNGIAFMERITPLLDVSCITTAWIVIGDAQSPFWAVYLYALVGYGRRYHGRPYLVFSSFIVVNMISAHMVIERQSISPGVLDARLVTMTVLAVAMASLSHAISSAWRNAERRARMLSEVDSLTGIANRRIFLERLEAVAKDTESEFALLMLDLDDFKRLNDEFGHLHGDEVLARVARVLSEGLREGDQVARYGGEEFVVMMPDITLREATEVAERLRATVFEFTPMSVSIGCAVRTNGESAESVLRRADDLLLAAKRNGKNTVRVSDLRRSA